MHGQSNELWVHLSSHEAPTLFDQARHNKQVTEQGKEKEGIPKGLRCQPNP